jgi:hypothetical protein
MIASMAASQKKFKTNPGPTNYQLEAAFFLFFFGLICTTWRISFQKMAKKNEKKRDFWGVFFWSFFEK